MGSAVWMSKYSDLDISIAQLKESVWPVRGDETPLDEETCLYTVASYLKHLFNSCKCCLCNLKYVSCIHRRFLPRCVAQVIFSSQLHCQLTTISASLLGCVQLNRRGV
jgi:hypothetical protein